LFPQLYNLLAIQYQGSINSGQGLPSVSKWAERQKASMDKQSYSNKNKMDTLKAGIDMLKLQQEAQVKLQAATTDEEKERVTRELEEHSVGILLRVLWTTTVVDITSTVYEVNHMVFFDQSVSKDVRMARSDAVKALGEIWMNQPAPAGDNEEEKDAKKLYEEAAFAAMLETVKRKDASHA
jgi:X-domain of DnaJ-containing